jgi:hypothetical protein
MKNRINSALTNVIRVATMPGGSNALLFLTMQNRVKPAINNMMSGVNMPNDDTSVASRMI